MPRKRVVRSDKEIGKVKKDLGLSTGAIRNKDGRYTRSDKKLATSRDSREPLEPWPKPKPKPR